MQFLQKYRRIFREHISTPNSTLTSTHSACNNPPRFSFSAVWMPERREKITNRDSVIRLSRGTRLLSSFRFAPIGVTRFSASGEFRRTVDGNNYINGVADKRKRESGSESARQPGRLPSSLPTLCSCVGRHLEWERSRAPRRKRNTPSLIPLHPHSYRCELHRIARSHHLSRGANPRALSSSQWRNAILGAVTRQ